MTNNKAFSLIIGCALTAAVLGLFPQIAPFRQSEALFARLFLMALIACFYIKDFWVKLFVLWIILRTALKISPYATTELNAIFLYAVTYQTIADNITKDRAKIVLNVIGIIMILQIIFMVAQYNGLWVWIMPIRANEGQWMIQQSALCKVNVALDWVRYRADNINGFTSNSSMSSMLLALGIPALLRRHWWVVMPFALWGISITSSISAIVPAVAVLSIYGLSKPKWRVYIISLIIALLVLTVWLRHKDLGTFLGNHGRFSLWLALIKTYVVKHPVMGWGIGATRFICEHAYRLKLYSWYELFEDPHNEYLMITLEAGVIGLILAVGGFINHIRKMLKNIDSVKFLVFLGILAGMLSAGANFTLHVTEGILLIVYLAIAQGLKQEELKCLKG